MRALQSSKVKGLLVQISERDSGSFEKNGQIVQYEAATLLHIVPFEDNQVLKYAIHPDFLDSILKTLADVHWGTLVEIKLEKRKVVSVSPIEDLLSGFYED